MEKKGCSYSSFCEADGCFFEGQVISQALVGGAASSTEHLNRVQQQGPYWPVETWRIYINATLRFAKRYNCDNLSELSKLIQQETQKKIENGQLLPSPEQTLTDDL